MSNFYRVVNKIGEADSPGTVIYLGELRENIFSLPGVSGKEEDVKLVPSRRERQNFFLQKKGAMEELISYDKGLELIKNYWVEKDVPMILQEKQRMTYVKGIPHLIMVNKYENLLYYSEVSSESNLFVAYDEGSKSWLFIEMERKNYEWVRLSEYSIVDALDLIVKKEFDDCFKV